MHFDDMNELQRRLHNAAIVAESDGDEWGHAGVMRDAIAEIERHLAGLGDLARYAKHLQARIDALMLEYCPDEMTPEQIAEWERHQRAVPNA